jgi:hypothetical protein
MSLGLSDLDFLVYISIFHVGINAMNLAFAPPSSIVLLRFPGLLVDWQPLASPI